VFGNCLTASSNGTAWQIPDCYAQHKAVCREGNSYRQECKPSCDQKIYIVRMLQADRKPVLELGKHFPSESLSRVLYFTARQ
jgi:hypothetical protein